MSMIIVVIWEREWERLERLESMEADILLRLLGNGA
jgi:hypothetical protein